MATKRPDSNFPSDQVVESMRMRGVTGISGYMLQRTDERREKMIAEIQANRRGEYKVPTWVLALILLAMIAAIVVALSLV